MFKKNNVWVFGCSSGQYYKDNSKYLFEFVSKKPGYKAVWLTRKRKVVEKITKEGRNCYYFYSPRGIYYSLIARYVFLSYSYNDVGFFCYLFSRKSKIIHLWHGTGPKGLEIELNRSSLNIFLRKMLRLYIGRIFDYMFTSSSLSIEKLNGYYKVEKDKFIVSGYPRNDVLFEENEIDYLNKIKEKISFSKVIFYLPTYREYHKNDGSFNFFDKLGFDENELVKVLERHNAVFLIKLHPNDYAMSENILKKFRSDRIQVVNDKDIESDIYPLLSKTNLLITDYSSVYTDFLILDRPVIFFCFDKEEYEEKDRGFYFDYEKITPGPKVRSWSEVCEKIEESLSGKDGYRQERHRVSSCFNQFADNKSCQRIFDFLISKS